jgi:hypothetical protein
MLRPQSYSSYLEPGVKLRADGWTGAVATRLDLRTCDKCRLVRDESVTRDRPHLTDRRQLAGSACSFSFVSPSVFSIKNGIRPEPEGVEASTKSDSYLMVVGRGGKRGEGGEGGGHEDRRGGRGKRRKESRGKWTSGVDARTTGISSTAAAWRHALSSSFCRLPVNLDPSHPAPPLARADCKTSAPP